MDVSVENTGRLGRRIKVSVPEAEVREKIRDKLAQLSREVRLKGFRPGKVPMNVVQKKFGESVRQEVIHNLVESSLTNAIKENDLAVAGRPAIESLDAEKDKNLEYVATLEIFPEIELQPLSELSVEQRVVEVSDKDVDAMQTKLLTQFADKPASEDEAATPLTPEALAEKLQIEGGVEKLHEELRKRLQNEADSVVREEVKEKVLELLLEKNTFELPKALLDQEKEAIEREIKQAGEQQQATEDNDTSPEAIEEAARKRVELGLLLNEVIKKFDLKPDAKKVQEQVLRIALNYPNPAEVFEAYQKNAQLRSSVERMVLLEQAVDAMLKEMQVTDVKVAFDEVMNQQEEKA